MTKPTLNFIWIGPPQFDRGGHDVLGLESFDENFKHCFSAEEETNPLVFWCLQEYADIYSRYFLQHQINTRVQGIEAHLAQYQTLAQENAQSRPQEEVSRWSRLEDQTQEILNSFIDLRNEQLHQSVFQAPKAHYQKVQQFVRHKEMFCNFLLTTQGHYVLDTNVMCRRSDQKVMLPHYDVFMYPEYFNTHRGYSSKEIWLLYAPPDFFKTGTNYLDVYLDELKKHRYDITDGLTECMITFRRLLDKIASDSWTGVSFAMGDVFIDELNIIKEYYNTHRAKKVYNAIQTHVIHGNYDKLLKDIQHGANLNILAHREYKFSLLFLGMSFLDNAIDGQRLQCLRLLLEHGANPNEINTKYNWSALIYAINYMPEALPLLLEFNASPNIYWQAQVISPLNTAIRLKNDAAALLLLEHHADPNFHLPTEKYTPLIYALRLKNSVAVKLLLDHGAEPDVLASGVSPSDVETNEACKTLLSEAIQVQASQRAIFSATKHTIQQLQQTPPESAQDDSQYLGL